MRFKVFISSLRLESTCGGSPAILGGTSWRSNVAKEARTRGFASPALTGFAFVATTIMNFCVAPSILGCAYARVSLSVVDRMPATGLAYVWWTPELSPDVRFWPEAVVHLVIHSTAAADPLQPVALILGKTNFASTLYPALSPFCRWCLRAGAEYVLRNDVERQT